MKILLPLFFIMVTFTNITVFAAAIDKDAALEELIKEFQEYASREIKELSSLIVSDSKCGAGEVCLARRMAESREWIV